MSKLKTLAAAAIGAAAAYWLDPDQGAGRRARTWSRLAARGRDLVSAGSDKLEYQKGVGKGVMHDVAGAFRRDREFDDVELAQKIRSEAVGPWMQRTGHEGDVDVAVDSGEVTLSGSLGDSDKRQSLLQLVENVEGVLSVSDELTDSV